MPTRRQFIAAGAAGAVALAVAGWLRGPHAPPLSVQRRALDADGEAILAAVIPVMLAGALPDDGAAHSSAVARTLAGVDTALAGLPPAAQHEFRQLTSLLASPPARWALAGVYEPWQRASADDVRRFLNRFRDSRFMLLRAAYGAFHQLVFAAWYGDPQSWPAIGYPGPPVLPA